MTMQQAEPVPRTGPEPITDGLTSGFHMAMIWAFVLVPGIALAAAIPLAWGWGLNWLDVGLAIFFYYLSGFGVTVGFHRYFTHSSFKAPTWLSVVLASAGSMAIQGSVIHWVADHRRHHAYSDKEGDPHSPWLYGTSPLDVAKGFAHAHIGWLFERDETNAKRFCPDLLDNGAIRRVDKLFPLWLVTSFLLPALIGGLVTWSWQGAASAFFWAGLVRVGLLHHVTWSINSICHMVGEQPFKSRDKSRNFWPLAVLSMGESWHNLHHADPTCARHGAQRGQIDMSARVIWLFEKFGWVHDVRWPTQRRLDRLARQAQ